MPDAEVLATPKPQERKAPHITNLMFTKDPNFITACEKAGVKPTKRMASKYRLKKGSAWKARNLKENS